MAVKSKAPGPQQSQPEISIRPARVRWSLGDLLSKDGHRLHLYFTCSIAVVDEPAERNLLREVFPNPASLTCQAVVNHFSSALRSTAEMLAASDNAEALLKLGAIPQWNQALRTAANEVAFMCGLNVLAPFEVELSSPTLQRERLEQMQRTAAERRSADRVGHFARAAELLKQWEQLKASVPSVTPGKLLEQVNPADRGLMLDTLLMANSLNQAGSSTPDLWAVSGICLVRVDLKNDSLQPRLLPLPTSAGPLRSVTPSNGALLVGARSGVIVVEPDRVLSVQAYLNPDLVSEHGFTSVTRIGDRIWGCHRVAGLVGWRVGEMSVPDVTLTIAELGGEPKYLSEAGLLAVGTKLCCLTPAAKVKTVAESASPLVAILTCEGQFIVARENGSLTQLDRQSLEKGWEIQTSGRLSGAAVLPWLSSSRLLLNRAEGVIDCIGLEDQLLTQFHSGQTGMRAVTACAGKIAAMSPDRQRILFWNPWEGRRTAGEVYLTGITHHRVADLAFL
jgi:hypothetical protein